MSDGIKMQQERGNRVHGDSTKSSGTTTIQAIL